MKFLTDWKFWTILYLISAVLFAQLFKKVNKNMRNASLLTILLEGFTAILSLLFVIVFPLKFSNNIYTYLTLITVTVIYAVTDRFKTKNCFTSNFGCNNYYICKFIISV